MIGWIMLAAALTACSVYVGTSLLFLKKPHLIRKSKKHRHHFPKCIHISHRGGAGERLENTITAFKHAVDVGSNMLELDCQICADGTVVVAHDPNLLRSCGVNRYITELNYHELPPLILDPQNEFHKNFLHQRDRRIPTLREVFQQFRDIPINIDIKTEDPQLLAETHKIINEFNRGGSVVWGNFRDTVTRACHELDPDIPLLFSVRRVVMIVIAFYLGFLPYIPLEEHFLEIPMPSVFRRHPFNFEPNWWQSILLTVIDKLLMSRRLFEHLRKRGVDVYLWVVNREEDWDRAFDDLGACGVMTDYPGKLSTYLRERGMTSEFPESKSPRRDSLTLAAG